METKEIPAMPESDKMIAVREESQAIGEFLESLERKGIMLMTRQESRIEFLDEDFKKNACLSKVEQMALRLNNPTRFEYIDGGYFRVRESIEQLLADHFGIDLKKVELEKRALLESLRK